MVIATGAIPMADAMCWGWIWRRGDSVGCDWRSEASLRPEELHGKVPKV